MQIDVVKWSGLFRQVEGEAIKFEMERRGLTVKDLEPMIGKSNRVYEILNHKRALTLKMIWKLHEELGIPAESLIKPPQAKAS